MTRAEHHNGKYLSCRWLAGLLCLFCFLSQSGCTLNKWILQRDSLSARTPALSNEATVDEVVDHLNNERARVMGWSSTDVKIAVRGEGIIPRLNATISVESPRRLRLMATSLRGTEVDFGSNDDRFWFWSRQSEPSFVLTGSHESLRNQQTLPIPFPPEWLMEALGVVPIAPDGLRLEKETTPGQVRLISEAELQGHPVQRVMRVDLAQGQVVEHALFDANHNLIVKATMSGFKRTESGVVLPHQIELFLPETKTELALSIRQIDVNPTIPETRWQFQNPPDSRIVDLDQPDAMVR
jgi:hypothetical protein